jgi:hypothetical protein
MKLVRLPYSRAHRVLIVAQSWKRLLAAHNFVISSILLSIYPVYLSPKETNMNV